MNTNAREEFKAPASARSPRKPACISYSFEHFDMQRSCSPPNRLISHIHPSLALSSLLGTENARRTSKHQAVIGSRADANRVTIIFPFFFSIFRSPGIRIDVQRDVRASIRFRSDIFMRFLSAINAALSEQNKS